MSSPQSAKLSAPKCQNDTLDCTLEELAIVKILRENGKAKQEEIASQIGKSLRTVKRIMAGLIEKKVIVRENGRRNGVWIVKKELWILQILWLNITPARPAPSGQNTITTPNPSPAASGAGTSTSAPVGRTTSPTRTKKQNSPFGRSITSRSTDYRHWLAVAVYGRWAHFRQ